MVHGGGDGERRRARADGSGHPHGLQRIGVPAAIGGGYEQGRAVVLPEELDHRAARGLALGQRDLRQGLDESRVMTFAGFSGRIEGTHGGCLLRAVGRAGCGGGGAGRQASKAACRGGIPSQMLTPCRCEVLSIG
ncbi:hypothetical protein GCM10020000_70680 [Streptomyces olivoverticillatus]